MQVLTSGGFYRPGLSVSPRSIAVKEAKWFLLAVSLVCDAGARRSSRADYKVYHEAVKELRLAISNANNLHRPAACTVEVIRPVLEDRLDRGPLLLTDRCRN